MFKKTPNLKFYSKIRKNVPAYGDFIKKNLNRKVKKWEDIPFSDKDSYFRNYSLVEKIYKDKKISDFYMICTSSGSTGEPTLWPRDISRDESAEIGHTEFLDEHFQILSKKTLIVISFGLGTSTAGMMHARLSWEANKKGNISVITPGVDVKETVLLVNSLYQYYDQVIFIGYPPLIKEIIDFGLKKRFLVKDWNLKVAAAGAGMTAKWRQTVVGLISKKKNDLGRVVSFFGCTETGMLGMETLEVNQIINFCIQNPKLRFDLFGTKNLPTLVELNIPGKYVEIINDEMVLSVDQPIPLIKYNVHDKAAFLQASQIKTIFNKYKIDFKFANLQKKYLVVFGRKETGDFIVEDFKFVLDGLNYDREILQEFQFKEELKERKRLVSLVLYQRVKLTKEIKNEIEKSISKLLNKKSKCQINFIWKMKNEKIGFMSGKLRYYL